MDNDKPTTTSTDPLQLKSQSERPQITRLISIFKALEMVLENFARRKRPAPFSEYDLDGLECSVMISSQNEKRDRFNDQ